MSEFNGKRPTMQDKNLLKCSRCGELKPPIKFAKHGEGRWHYCRSCGTEVWERNRRREGLDPSEIRKTAQNRRASGLSGSRGNYEEILSNSKLRDSHYENQVTLSYGSCHICQDRPNKLSRDHCHTRNEWRGVLCRYCNPAIGFFKENKKILINSIEYLLKSREKKVYSRHERVPLEIKSCEICECVSPFPGRNGRLQVDHCHKTGFIRGYLCHHCNTGLGFFRDEVQYISNAIHYLDYWGFPEKYELGIRDYSWRNTSFRLKEENV